VEKIFKESRQSKGENLCHFYWTMVALVVNLWLVQGNP